jgi:hypothetical protein
MRLTRPEGSIVNRANWFSNVMGAPQQKADEKKDSRIAPQFSRMGWLPIG